MEIQEQLESIENEASDIILEIEAEQENNRLYGNNGLQGPLTEDGVEEGLQRSENSSCSLVKLTTSYLHFLVLLISLLTF